MASSSSPTRSVRKKGYLFKLPVSGGVIKVWAKRWAVLHATTHEGVVRLEYYDNEEAEVRGVNKRVILLRNCTGCIETSEFKSRPYAFQFTTQQGRHVFATDSGVDLESWVDCINDVMREDRKRAKKNVQKNSMAETVRREPEASGHAPHVGTLMGVYNVAINQTDLSKALNLSGTYSLDVTPQGMSLISNSTETEIIKWHYKHIKSYAKSSKNVITLEMGRRSPTGEGKFVFHTTVAKELFSMIHRNIKKIKIAREKKIKEDVAKQVERLKETQRKKREEEGARRRTVRPHSQSYDFDPSSSRRAQTIQRQPTIGGFTSSSTIGTVADEDMIQLEGLAGVPGIDDFQDLLDGFDTIPAGRNRLSMGTSMGEKLELDSLKPLTDLVYQNPSTIGSPPASYNQPPHRLGTTVRPVDDIYDEPYRQGTTVRPVEEIYDEPPREEFGDSFTDGPGTNTTADPFANATDPFASSPQGSFYNSNEDIFQSFDQLTSPHKTSTPNNPWGNTHTTRNVGGHVTNSSSIDPKHPPANPIYSNTLQQQNKSANQVHGSTHVDVLRGLKDIQLNNTSSKSKPPVPKPRTMKRMSESQMEEMWADIAGDFKIPN